MGIAESIESTESIEALRAELVAYVRRKFYTRRNIYDMAEDIVNQAFHDVAQMRDFSPDKHNFGYMSVVCIRRAYKVFHRNDQDMQMLYSLDEAAPLVDENSFVEDVEAAEDTAFIMDSLVALKQMEQVIIRERYYGQFTFREISERHGIKINTVLSHHRRALEKLRPILSLYFEFKEEI